MTSTFPDALRRWVEVQMGKMDNSNRQEATEEMKKVIQQHSVAGDMWTFDWSTLKLQSLEPKSSLKRKFQVEASSSKKGKKALKGSNYALDTEDEIAKAKRARRFEREHEIERQRARNGGVGFRVESEPLFPPYNHSTGQITQGVSDLSLEPGYDPNVIDWDRYTIVGKSNNLFKDYLRLTTEPNPNDIRPLNVLTLTLKELKRIWREKNDYKFINNQFKSLRQDLTVQRIKNEFTVLVYEIHARMALEAGDMVEYNQCQGMLRHLYDLGLPGSFHEFLAYRILSMVHGRNKSEMNLLVGQLTKEQKAVPAVRHALEVSKALTRNNYHAFFHLFASAPNMGGYIMDHFVEEKRVQALMTMCKAYMTLPLSFIEKQLSYDSLSAARASLAAHNAAIFKNPYDADSDKTFDCKAALPCLAASFEEKYRKVGIKGRI
ncbi:SAC3/GANP/Nin1/mts3/eIF-3 p25 family-domain-containing protein [Hysterangium stoloniferum]|nr:SAC3/GANP/Nin1/mts3/eIF-3 p25 family-domain-containing protein [Hysterangium stoloniferum]